MRAPTAREQEKAQEILAWVPRPLYLSGRDNAGKSGPGILKLQSIGLLGYTALRSMANGVPTKPFLYPKLEMLYKHMKKELETPVVVERKPATAWLVVLDDGALSSFLELQDAMEAVDQHSGRGIYLEIDISQHEFISNLPLFRTQMTHILIQEIHKKVCLLEAAFK